MTEILKKYKIWIGVVALIVSFGLGFFVCKKTMKPRVITKVEIQEKIVEKIITVEVEKKAEKKHIIRKIVEKPDGTKETIIEEKTETSTESSKKNKKDAKKETETKIDEKVAIIPAQYRVSAEWFLGVDDIKRPTSDWGFEGEIKVLGPFWAGVGYARIQEKNYIILKTSMEF